MRPRSSRSSLAKSASARARFRHCGIPARPRPVLSQSANDSDFAKSQFEKSRPVNGPGRSRGGRELHRTHRPEPRMGRPRRSTRAMAHTGADRVTRTPPPANQFDPHGRVRGVVVVEKESRNDQRGNKDESAGNKATTRCRKTRSMRGALEGPFRIATSRRDISLIEGWQLPVTEDVVSSGLEPRPRGVGAPQRGSHRVVVGDESKPF